jgi:hypothetical protein
MRQLSRAIRVSCDILRNSYVSCEVWKSLYVGLRVAFHSEFNTQSQLVFNSLFEEIFEVKQVAEKYMQGNFFFFRFHNISSENILHISSDNLGLLMGNDMQTNQQEKTSNEIECIYLNDQFCLMNIMNHPIKIKIDDSLKNKIKEKKLQIEKTDKIKNKQLIFDLNENKKTVAESTKPPYIITEKLKSNILDLLKLVSFSDKLPVLLEGPTSTGKTSVVMFLANLLGKKVYRVNNHKDTDLEEYVGSYQPSVEKGGLRFQYGVLARAIKEGSWLLLDELNLAKSEILEALNR